MRSHPDSRTAGVVLAALALGLVATAGAAAPAASPLAALRQAAEGGDAAARHELGVHYFFGTGGVSLDRTQARKWLRLAAEDGHLMAAYRLGFMDLRGYGGDQDYVQAHVWFDVCAGSGFGDAAAWREYITAKMTRRELAEVERLAGQRPKAPAAD